MNYLIQKFRILQNNEKSNVISHGVGLILAIIFGPILIIHQNQDIGYWVFFTGMLFVYFASTRFHLEMNPKSKNAWRIVDHISIFFMIGGTYTPFVLKYYGGEAGIWFLIVQWSIIAIGVILKLIFKTKFELISVLLYLTLGWMIIFVYQPMTANMPSQILTWIIIGGVFYTLGVVFYLWEKWYWHHTVWHIFVLGGSASHYIALFMG